MAQLRSILFDRVTRGGGPIRLVQDWGKRGLAEKKLVFGGNTFQLVIYMGLLSLSSPE